MSSRPPGHDVYERRSIAYLTTLRPPSYAFGPDIVSKFLQKFDLDLIARAHQVVVDGYEFFANRQLVTLFTAPNYCSAVIYNGNSLTMTLMLISLDNPTAR